MNAELKTRNDFAAHLQLDCECGCGNGFRFIIEKLPDDELTKDVWIMSTTSKFDEKQRWSAFLERIKTAWNILTNKEFWYHSIILHEDDVKALRKFLNNYVKTKK